MHFPWWGVQGCSSSLSLLAHVNRTNWLGSLSPVPEFESKHQVSWQIPGIAFLMLAMSCWISCCICSCATENSRNSPYLALLEGRHEGDPGLFLEFVVQHDPSMFGNRGAFFDAVSNRAVFIRLCVEISPFCRNGSCIFLGF